MQKRVLLTGAAGFLGREVLRQLKTKGDVAQILAIDNCDPLCGGLKNAAGVVFGDILDPTIFGEYEATHVIHLAALGRNLTCEKNPYRAIRVNIDGTLAMLELAHAAKASIIVCSSNIVLSDVATVYRMTKRATEDLTRIYAQNGLQAMVLRPSNMAGIGQSRTEFQPCSFASMDVCFEKNGYIEITGDGKQRRDFINVKDVARAFVAALDNIIPGRTFDICDGATRNLLDVMSILGVQFKFVAPRQGDAKNLISDHRPAANELGFRVSIPFDQTVAESFPSVTSAKALHTN